MLTLTATLGGGLLLLFGLGWLPGGFALHGNYLRKHVDTPIVPQLGISVVLGMIINLGIVLIIQDLSVSLLVALLLAVVGLGLFAVYLFKNRPLKHPGAEPAVFAAMVLVVLGVYLSMIIGEPLQDWDARSLWFFHAKVIYVAQTIGPEAGWQHPSVITGHTDYPKLIQVMAGQVGYLAGYWNEYLPKAAIFYLLVPAVLLLMPVDGNIRNSLLLVLLIPISLGSLLWNGYMDGYLAFYVALSVLLFGRFIVHSRRVDLFAGVVCLLFVINMKNEGQLAVIAGVGAIGFVLLFFALRERKWSWGGIPGRFGWLVLALGPHFLWTRMKSELGLPNDLLTDNNNLVSTFLSRFDDTSYKLIFEWTVNEVGGSALLMVFLLVVLLGRKTLRSFDFLPALTMGVIYGLGMVAIYFITPRELAWHLSTSASRTFLTVNACFYVSSYFLLKQILDGESVYNQAIPSGKSEPKEVVN